MRRLIVNADDFALSPGVTEGIRQAHERGIVTSTTAMMNIPGAPEAVRAAALELPRLGLGVHLNLTSGAPLHPAASVPTLVGCGGTFPEAAALRGQLAVGRELPFHRDEVLSEWTLQIEYFIRAAGRGPDHLDTHHHIGMWSPELAETLFHLARTYRCPVRRPEARNIPSMPEASRLAIITKLEMLVKDGGVSCPGHTIARFYGGNATPEALLGLIHGLGDGTTELMCHPAVCDDLLRRRSAYAEARESELALLTDGRLREILEASGVVLCRFGDLRA